MPFVPITDAEIASGQPVIGPGAGFGKKTKDNFDFFNGQIGSIAANDILNGSFEVEDDAVSGVPANWDRTLFAGGAGAFDTVAPMHGAQSYKFTHPGGGGNGGGTLESDFFAIGEILPLFLEWMHYVSAAGMHETVEIEYFTGPQVSISTQTIYDSTSNPTSPTIHQEPLVIPATARFLKVKVIGGDDDVDVAGDSFWDGVRVVFKILRNNRTEYDGANTFTIANSSVEETTTSTSYVKLKEILVTRDGTIDTSFQLKRTGAGGTAFGQIRIDGTPVGTERSTVSTSYVTFTEDIAVTAGDLLQLYVKRTAGTSAEVQNFLIRDGQPWVELVIT